ncbi:carboxymuconolactone decarboxylase family protein [Mycolicibacterium goodii]|uniref:carboxymuconolactone decarboxylase family protein n=1 Tax=Mycolicibacterium goodii TaxID=134601 RepID=UPI00296F9A23
MTAALASAVLATACSESSPSGDADPTAQVESVDSISPALKRYGDEVLENQLWQRPDLAPRERSIVTVAAMIARNQIAELPFYMNRALDNGVTPAQLSEIITHLAFYSGWPNAMAAVEAAKPVFTARDIGTDQLPDAKPPELLPIDQEFESARRARVESTHGTTGQGVQHFTTDVLFTDLWLRPDLPPRDRSLTTVSALVATGLTGQITSHLNIAMDNGLTEAQANEVLTQLAFYAGWPRAFSAMPVFKEVFEARP